MLKFFKQIYLDMCEQGIRFPFSYDPVSKSPSVTLFFAYISFITMFISLVLLHIYKQLLEATIVSTFIWIISVTFYRLRELDKINLNIKTGGISLEDDNLPKDKEVK
jgi:hypothetical protein